MPMNYLMVDLNQYWMWSNMNEEESKMTHELSPKDPISPIYSTPAIQRERRVKKKNKWLYKPFIIEKADSTLNKILEVPDKDEIIFK